MNLKVGAFRGHSIKGANFLCCVVKFSAEIVCVRKINVYLCNENKRKTDEQIRDSFLDSVHSSVRAAVCHDTAGGIPLSAQVQGIGVSD